MYIYIVTHPKFEGWIKLGRAIDVQKRLNSYQCCCPNRDFKLEYNIQTEYYYNIETYFHNFIKNNGWEWYECSSKYAINKIKEVLSKIKNDENYLRRPVFRKTSLYNQKKKWFDTRYDYIIDDIIFNSVNEVSNYIGVECSTYARKVREQGNKNFVEIDNFKIIRQNHVK